MYYNYREYVLTKYCAQRFRGKRRFAVAQRRQNVAKPEERSDEALTPWIVSNIFRFFLVLKPALCTQAVSIIKSFI